MAKWLESRTRNPIPAGIVGGGSECTALSSTFNTTTDVSLSKAPNPQLLPGRRSINGCPLLRVCVNGVCVHCCVCALGWIKCRAQIPSMGNHTWPHVTSLSQNRFFFCAAVSADYISAVTVTNSNNSKQIWQKQKAEHTDYQQKHKVKYCCSISSPQFQEQIFINRTNK